jgi:hypothetical protein
METMGRRRTGIGILAAAVLSALALAGCGTTTIDNVKLQDSISQDVAAAGSFKVKSVSCPSDVAPKAGTTLSCKISVTKNSDGSVHSGTVTVHMTDAKGHVTISGSDFNIQ